MCRKWNVFCNENDRKETTPSCVDNLAEMIRSHFKGDNVIGNMHEWDFNAPYILQMIAIMLIVAGTSSYAERTSHLAED